MGFNTSVIVMNDALGWIEEDPEFGKNLARAIAEASRGKPVDVPAHSGRGGVHCNAATVIESHHADGYQAVLVGGNMGQKLGRQCFGQYDDHVEMLKQIASDLGYRLVKKPKK